MPIDPDAAFYRAEQFQGLGQYDRALEIVGEALGEHPNDSDLLMKQAQLLSATGRLGAAEKAANAAVAADPNATGPLLVLANLMQRRGRPAWSRHHLDQVLRMAPDLGEAHMHYALTYIGRRDDEGRAAARRAYRRALEVDGGTSRFLRLAAMVEHDFGDDRAALGFLDDALSRDPQNPELLKARADYTPVSQQTAMVTGLLASNPGESEYRELLDNILTWRRRLALTPVVLAPLLPAWLLVVMRTPMPTAVGAGIALVASLLGGLSYLDYRRSLPEAYLRVRASEFGGRAVSVGTRILSLALVAGAGVAVFRSVVLAAVLLGAAGLAGVVAAAIVAADDHRVLTTARDRTGRAWYGTANRFGSLRLELALWTSPVVAIVGAVAFFANAPSAPPGGKGASADVVAPVVAAGAAFLLVAVLTLVETLIAARSVPLTPGRQKFFMARYFFSGAVSLAMLLALVSGLQSGFRPEAPRPDDKIVIPTYSFPSEDFSVPPITFPTPSFPSVSIPPAPRITLPPTPPS